MNHLRSCFLQLLVSVLMVLPVFAGDLKPMQEIVEDGIVRVKIDASDVEGRFIQVAVF